MALALLALLATSSYFILESSIQSDETSAALINVSGFQRMLSQRIATFSLNRVIETNPVKKEEILQYLMKAIDLMEKSHAGLLNGDASRNLPGNPSQPLRVIYFESPLILDTKVRNFLSDAKSFASLPSSEQTLNNSHLNSILTAAREELLYSLDKAVKQYQIESESHISYLRDMGTKILGFSLFFLLVVGICIFRPMARRAQEENKFVKLLQVVTVSANEAKTTEEAIKVSLDQICDHIKWPVGHLYVVDENSSRKLIPTTLWHMENLKRFKRFKEVTMTMDFSPGVGLPGRVMSDGKPAWVFDVTKDSNFPRADLLEDIGLKGGIAFPVLIGNKVVAVMEFFSEKVAAPNERLLEVMAHCGVQLGRVFERNRAEMELQKSHDTLEYRVEERTTNLRTMNEKLEYEIGVRKKIETELERSNNELTDFASIASHDLKEPLRKVVFFCEHIKKEYEDVMDDKGRDYLLRIRKATKKMQRFIEDLLAYSRVTVKARPFETIDLRELIEEVVSDLEVIISQSGGKVEVFSLPTLDVDRLQILELFQNLISNALKYQEKESIPNICVKSVKNEDATWEISFKDNGIGFDDQYIERIFKPFERLHGRSSPYEGTGMGLAICKKIVDRHNGTITAKSARGKGSTFIITLPEKQVRV